MTQKIALVTGASGGIGRSVTTALAANGFYVFAAARRMDRLETLRADNIEPLQLDVTNTEALSLAVSHIQSVKDHVDVLVNNAGYGLYGTVEGLTYEQVRSQFDVNVFGLGQLTQAVLPLMRRQQSGHIVNITSVVGKVSLPFAGWYCASKHAVEALSDALRVEVNPFGIKVVVIEPGAIKTEFDEIALAALDNSNDPDGYSPHKQSFRKLIEDTYRKAPGPDIVARMVLKAVTTSSPRRRYAIPLDSKALILLRRLCGDRAYDWIIQRHMR